MAAKYLNPQNHLSDTDIRFEPEDKTLLIELIESEPQVPKIYRHLLIGGAQIRFASYHFGVIFSQKVIARQNIFWLHCLDIRLEVALTTVTNALLISLNYMLRGHQELVINKEHLSLQAEKYQLCGIAAHMHCPTKFSAGRSLYFQTMVPADLFPEMIALCGDGQQLSDLLSGHLQCVYYPHSFRITPPVLRHIDIILAQKKAMTAKEKLRRDIKWERELLGLLQHFLEDKAGVTKMSEWNNKGSLQMANLKEFVIDSLKYQGNAGSDLLQFNKIRWKLGIGAERFRVELKTRFGCTWQQFIHQVRMEHGATLLTTDPYLSISDISALLGYAVPSHFARAFKEYFGEKPLEYRKNHIVF